ncbi:MAG: CHAP domain-containing protein [Clostridia bacterium]|nr:CHAP domain-containing protein [Clostridia bacterium]
MTKSKRIIALMLAVVMFVGMAVSSYGYNDNYPNTHRNTGQHIADLIAVARTQIGYAELDPSTGFPIAHNGRAGYTKYGESFGAPTGEWCAYFVSWCARQAGIPTSVLPRLGNCAASVKWYKNHSVFRTPSSGYIPKAGDIVFYNWSGGETAKHVGIVTGVSGRNLYTIEGNTGEGRGYDCLAKTRDLTANYIVGYGVPAYNDAKTYVGSHSFANSVSGGSISSSDSIRYTTSKLAVITTTATEITATNAVLNGSISNGGRLFVSTAGFFFGTDKVQLAKYPTVTATSKPEIGLTMDVTEKVGVLTPNTTYYYQTYACIDGRDYLGPMYAVVTVNDVPQKLVLNASSVHVGVGQTAEIMWAQLPVGSLDKGVTWTSSDEKVATVTNDGIVKGVGYGKVTLNAKTNYGDADASCTATVLIPSPSNVRLINESKDNIRVKWDAVNGATGYVLYRSSGYDSEPVEYAYVSADSTEFVDTNVIPGERYYYSLMTLAEIVDYNSDPSPVLYTTARLRSPENVLATNYGALLSVSWSQVDEAKSYTVYRANDEFGLYTIVGEVTTTCFVDHNVFAGRTYYYKIVATNGDEKTVSDYSQVSSVVARLDERVTLDDNSLLPSQKPVPKKSNDAEISRTHPKQNVFMF